MNAWRNILTALWCAILFGQSAYALFLLSDIGVMDRIGDLPWPVLVTVILLVVFCLSALVAMAFIEALIVASVALAGMWGLAMSGMWNMGMLGRFGGGSGLLLIQMTLVMGLIIIGSLAIVLWNRTHKNYIRAAKAAVTGEF